MQICAKKEHLPASTMPNAGQKAGSPPLASRGMTIRRPLSRSLLGILAVRNAGTAGKNFLPQMDADARGWDMEATDWRGLLWPAERSSRRSGLLGLCISALPSMGIRTANHRNLRSRNDFRASLTVAATVCRRMARLRDVVAMAIKQYFTTEKARGHGAAVLARVLEALESSVALRGPALSPCWSAASRGVPASPIRRPQLPISNFVWLRPHRALSVRGGRLASCWRGSSRRLVARAPSQRISRQERLTMGTRLGDGRRRHYVHRA